MIPTQPAGTRPSLSTTPLSPRRQLHRITSCGARLICVERASGSKAPNKARFPSASFSLTTGSGIVFTNDVDDIRVQGNNILLNGWAGIQVDGGRECVIADNLISNNYTNNIRAVGRSSGFNIERNWFEDPGVYQNPVVHWSIQTEYGNVGEFGFGNPWPYNWHFSGNYYSIGAPRFAIRLDCGSGFTFGNEMINQGYLLSSASVSNFMILASVSNVFSFNLAGEGGYAVLPANLSIQTWGTNLTVWDIRMLGGLTINGSVTFGNPITLLSDLAIAGRLFATNGCGLWGNVGVGKYPATTALDVNGSILASGGIGINTNGLSHSLEVLRYRARFPTSH